jgi:DNA polymerase-1
MVPNTYFVARRKGSVYITGNTPDQGSVADVIKIAMRNLFREWKDRGVLYDYYTKQGKVKILSQVHDELICELRDDFAEEGACDIRRHMEHSVELRAPMTAVPGIGKNWNLAKKDGKRRESEAN